MKNKNGFIATGLIYSFFLIFLTLFLTVIINNMNNKGHLSELEASIKSDLNSYKYVRDFNPGDLISFVDKCTNAGNFEVDKSYVVASVNTNMEDEDDHLVLYSYKLHTSLDEGLKLTLDTVQSDISSGYLNGTYINKIIYNFDTSGGQKEYSLGSYKVELKSTGTCYETVRVFCTDYGKLLSGTSSKYRKRILKKFKDNRIKKCPVEDAMGVIYVEGSI